MTAPPAEIAAPALVLGLQPLSDQYVEGPLLAPLHSFWIVNRGGPEKRVLVDGLCLDSLHCRQSRGW